MSFLSRYFGERIREFRKKKGYTQSRLAERLGVEPPTVSRWEAGEYLPTDPSIDALPGALGVTPEDFLQIQAKPSPAVSALTRAIDALEAENQALRAKLEGIRPDLLEAISRASEDEQELLLMRLTPLPEEGEGGAGGQHA